MTEKENKTEYKTTIILVEPTLYKQFKTAVILQNTTMTHVFRELMQDFVNKVMEDNKEFEVVCNALNSYN